MNLEKVCILAILIFTCSSNPLFPVKGALGLLKLDQAKHPPAKPQPSVNNAENKDPIPVNGAKQPKVASNDSPFVAFPAYHRNPGAMSAGKPVQQVDMAHATGKMGKPTMTRNAAEPTNTRSAIKPVTTTALSIRTEDGTDYNFFPKLPDQD